MIYYDYKTTNTSFLKAHKYLKSKGIANNYFMLAIKNPNLIGVDPYQSKLSEDVKLQIIQECKDNYWYFMREVARVMDSENKPVQYELDRSSLAFNYMVQMNTNIFYEKPGRRRKTTEVLVRLLWEHLYNIGDYSSRVTGMYFENSKPNLHKLKQLKDLLPLYANSHNHINNEDTLENITGPRIDTSPSPKDEHLADVLGRNVLASRIYLDDWANMKFNREFYKALMPTFKASSSIAKDNKVPYGIIITTIAGKISKDECMFAYEMRNSSMLFEDSWYDKSISEIRNILKSYGTDIPFVHIKYSYNELGLDGEWFKNECKLLNNDWKIIKSEFLLEWE